MRYQTYLRKTLATGLVEELAFEKEHFKQAGVPASLMSGMPMLEAYELVNRWNVTQLEQQFLYALPVNVAVAA